jgi:hypothetical protein
MYSIEELANDFRKLGACDGDAVMLHVAAVETAGVLSGLRARAWLLPSAQSSDVSEEAKSVKRAEKLSASGLPGNGSRPVRVTEAARQCLWSIAVASSGEIAAFPSSWKRSGPSFCVFTSRARPSIRSADIPYQFRSSSYHVNP